MVFLLPSLGLTCTHPNCVHPAAHCLASCNVGHPFLPTQGNVFEAWWGRPVIPAPQRLALEDQESLKPVWDIDETLSQNKQTNKHRKQKQKTKQQTINRELSSGEGLWYS